MKMKSNRFLPKNSILNHLRGLGIALVTIPFGIFCYAVRMCASLYLTRTFERLPGPILHATATNSMPPPWGSRGLRFPLISPEMRAISAEIA